MAIKIGPKKRRTAMREFTDRLEPRKAFWKRYGEMCSKGSTIISYYGAGGVGKSSLLKKLMDEIDNRAAHLRENVFYVHYDFDNDLDTRTTLQDFKSQLAKQGCEFPLFETGDFYYQFSTGNANETDVPKMQSILDKSTWFNKVKSNWSKTTTIVDLLVPGVNVAAVAISFVGEKLIEFWKENRTFDEYHREINFRLNEARMSDNSYEIYKLLPELFARDVSDWLEKSEDKKKVLVVFLDTYEALVNETIVANQQRSYDDWLKSDSGDPTGIIFLIPNTLWVIAGRNKLRWDNELADELDQHLITALSADDSTNFLEKAGIKNPTLREEIAALTQGFPIYLDLCVDVYERYKQRNNGNEPSISDFGDSRRKVVERLLKYMDAPLQDMVKFLCTLNYWTDEIACELGRIALPNFSHTLYEQVKHFSFIQPDSLQVEDFSADIWVFDKNIYDVLFAELHKMVLNEILEGAKKYFSEKLKNLKEINGEYIFYANFYANLVVRLIDDSNELRKIFDDINSGLLIEWAKYDTAGHIIKLFLEKTATLDNNAGENLAYFKRRLADVKRAQGLFLESLELNESALNILLAENNPDNHEVLLTKNDLAGTLDKLGRYDEALKLQEEVLEVRKKILGKKHPDTLVAMNNLAGTLTELGRYKESLKLQEEFLDFSKEIFGVKHPKTITAMNNLAVTLNDIRTLDDLAESNDKALKLQREVLKLSKETFGEKHPDTLLAMNNLAITLNEFGGYNEALELQEEVLTLSKKIFGEKHPDTLLAMNNLAGTLSDLGRYEETLTLQEEVLTLSSEILGAKHPSTISAKSNFAATLRDLGRCEEALKLQEEVLEVRKKILGENHLDTIYAKSELAVTLSKLQRYDEALQLQQEVLTLRQEILGDHHPATAIAIEDLIDTFTELENFDEVIKLMEKLSDAFGAGVGDEQIEIS